MCDCYSHLAAGKPVPVEVLRAHYGHTLQAMLLWELLLRKDGPKSDSSLGEARIAYTEAVETHFPEVVPP